MFLSFASQEERRAYGGSCFIELQLCRLPKTTPLKSIVSIDNIEDWKEDSLYVHADDADFYEAYGSIFTGGLYNNLERGTVDLYGINYYDPALTEEIIRRIQSVKPPDHECLTDWLEKAGSCNGFYILGV